MPEYVYEVRFDQGRIYRWKVCLEDGDTWVVQDSPIRKRRRLNKNKNIFESLEDAISQLLTRLREREIELLHQVGVVRAKIDACESRDEGMQHMRLIMDGDK